MAAELEYDVVNELIDLEPQFIGHYHSVHSVDESQFSGIKDPLVIFRDRGTQVQVKVIPFQAEAETEMATKSFEEKFSYFQRKISSLETGTKEEDIAADLTVTSVKRRDILLGNYADFINAYANPSSFADDYETVEAYFDSMYLDLKESNLTDFRDALLAAL